MILILDNAKAILNYSWFWFCSTDFDFCYNIVITTVLTLLKEVSICFNFKCYICDIITSQRQLNHSNFIDLFEVWTHIYKYIFIYKLFLNIETLKIGLVWCCLLSIPFFFWQWVSFFWFVSPGLLTVLCALAIGLLGMLLAQNILFIFFSIYNTSLLYVSFTF